MCSVRSVVSDRPNIEYHQLLYLLSSSMFKRTFCIIFNYFVVSVWLCVSFRSILFAMSLVSSFWAREDKFIKSFATDQSFHILCTRKPRVANKNPKKSRIACRNNETKNEEIPSISAFSVVPVRSGIVQSSPNDSITIFETFLPFCQMQSEQNSV